MKKRKNNGKLTVYILLITVATLIIVASSYARYTTTISGSDEAIVAKFDVSAKDLTETINLFDCIDEDAVLDSDGLVAPGTKGSFTTILNNDSEVTVSYALSITETNSDNIPIVYSLEEGGTYVSASEFANLTLAKGTLDFTGTTKENPVTSKELTIYWKWEIDGDNEIDTDLGKAAADADDNATIRPNAQATLGVNFTQVD